MVTEPVCAGMLANARTDQDLADLRERAKQLRTAFTRMPRFAY